MTKTIRYLLFAICTVQFAMAAAFCFQMPFATGLWPFPGTTPLTFIFVGSFFAAAAASTLWVAATERWGALAGIGLDYAAILAPASVLSFQRAASTGSTQATAYGIACLVGALMGLAMLAWSIRIPLDRSIPMPGVVRVSFVIFIAVLLLVSGQLILKRPNVIPWKITPELSLLIGWMFLGAAIYFAYGLLRPCWENAAGQLAGFFAYDVVLIAPLLMRIPVAPAEHRTGLYIYIAVVVYSGLVATYYLFVHAETRVFGPAGHVPAQTA